MLPSFTYSTSTSSKFLFSKIGVISNIIDLVDDEMGEDYAMLAGLTAEEDLKEPLKESMKKRMPWLIILLDLPLPSSLLAKLHAKTSSQNSVATMTRAEKLKDEQSILLKDDD